MYKRNAECIVNERKGTRLLLLLIRQRLFPGNCLNIVRGKLNYFRLLGVEKKGATLKPYRTFGSISSKFAQSLFRGLQ